MSGSKESIVVVLLGARVGVVDMVCGCGRRCFSGVAMSVDASVSLMLSLCCGKRDGERE